MKRDLNTKEIALYFHIPVEEARRLRTEPSAEGGLATAVADAPELKEDSNALYCKNRTNGVQHCLEINSERYCMLQAKCRSQRDNGTRAKICCYHRT